MDFLRRILFWLVVLLFPTQLGRHFWPQWSQILGLRVDYLSPTIYLTDIFILLLFIFSLPIIFSATKKFCRENRNVFFLFAGFVFALALGVFRSERPPAGFYQLARWTEMVFFAIVIGHQIKTPSQLKKLTLFLCLGVIFESFLALGQFLKQGSLGGLFWFFGERTFSGQTPGIAQADLTGELVVRPYGTFSHPNALSGYLIVVLILILGVHFVPRGVKVAKWIALFVGFLALFFTFSRLAWIVGFPALFTSFISQKKWGIIFLMVVFLILSSGLVQSRFQTLSNFGDESWQRRQELNSAAWRMVKVKPLLGVGMGNFLVELPQFHDEGGAVRFLQPAHNVYLMVLAENGLLGLTATLGVIFFTLRRLKKQLDSGTAKQFYSSLLLAFLSILTLSFLDHYFYTLWQTQLLSALVIGLAWIKLEKT